MPRPVPAGPPGHEPGAGAPEPAVRALAWGAWPTHALAPPVSEALHIPSPSITGFHIGPLFIHFYAVMYLIGIAVAIIMTRRRWAAAGGDPELIYDVAMWSVPAGIIGGRMLLRHHHAGRHPARLVRRVRSVVRRSRYLGRDPARGRGRDLAHPPGGDTCR